MSGILEVLGRVNAKTNAFSVGLGTSGTDSLSAHDISSALAGIPRGPYLLARAKYCGDETVINELISITESRALRLAHRSGWSMRYSDRIKKMALLALAENNIQPHICSRCKGRREIIRRKPKLMLDTCPSCGGSGRYERSENSKARYVGFRSESWRRVWGERYVDVRAMLWRWESIVLRQLLKKIRGIQK